MEKLQSDSKLYKNPHLLMVVYSFLVSLSFIVGHAITNDIKPEALTLARFFLGTLLFGGYVFSKYRIALPTFRQFMGYLAISASLVGYFLCMFYSLRYTSSWNDSVIYTLVPVYTAVFGGVFLREFPGVPRSLILLVTLAGSLWVISGGDARRLLEMQFNRGDLIFIFGCMLMGIYPVLSKKFAGNLPTPVLTFWTLLAGTLILFFVSAGHIGSTDWFHLPLRVYLGLGYITVFTTVITFFIVQYASMRMHVSRVMGYIYVIPVFVIAENFVLGGVMPSLRVLPGVVLILAGLVYFMRERG